MLLSNKTLGKAGSLTAAFLTVVMTEHFGKAAGASGDELIAASGPVLAVIGDLVKDELVVPLGKEIIEQFSRKRPYEFNTELQTLILDSMNRAVRGIGDLFEDKY